LPPPRKANAPAPFYLPDFCAAGNVLAVVLIAELVAVLLTLARYGIAEKFWIDLARTSLFLLWAGMGSAAVLCVSRPRLQQFDVRRGSTLALGLMLLVTVVITEAAWWLATTSGRLLGMEGSELGSDHAAFLWRNLLVGAVAGGLALRYFYVSQQWKRNVEAEAAARVRALQARIRPHFLFNSMNAIAALTRTDPARAEEAVADLADLFRVSLREVRDRIPLEQEIEIARTYERIERLRLGDRLQVDWQLDGLPRDARVPALVRDGRFVELSIDNPRDPSQPLRGAGNRIGLDNVAQRLDLMFPGEGTLDVDATDRRFVATLRFPAEEAGA